MALTLHCMCEDNEAASSCELMELWFEGSSTYTSTGIGASFGIALLGGTVPYSGNDGSWSVAMDLADKELWSGLHVELIVTSALVQLPTAGAFALNNFTWKIREVWQCYVNGVPAGDPRELISVDGGGEQTCQHETGSVVTAYITGNKGSAAGIMYQSSSLTDMGCTVSFGNFDSNPATTELVDPDASGVGSLCICASGGTPPYYFVQIAGEIPPGMSFNNATGCFEGIRTAGNQNDYEVTIMVTDAGGVGSLPSYITCRLLGGCAAPSVPAAGNVSH